jgi:hypothetical protein
MSVGIRKIVSPPRMAMSIDITTNVYGRLSARRTSHIMGVEFLVSSCRPTAHEPPVEPLVLPVVEEEPQPLDPRGIPD